MPMVGGFGAAKTADDEVVALLSHAAVAAAIEAAAGAGAVTPFSYKTQVVRCRGAAPHCSVAAIKKSLCDA